MGRRGHLRTKVVYEENASVSYRYGKMSQLNISTVEPADTMTGLLFVDWLEEKYDGTIVNWKLSIEEAFDSFTDVLGNCYRILYSKTAGDRDIPIHVSFQGLNCQFWERINSGDSIQVIGEIDFAASNIEPLNVVNNLQPLMVRHKDTYFTFKGLPRKIRKQLIEVLAEPLNKN